MLNVIKGNSRLVLHPDHASGVIDREAHSFDVRKARPFPIARFENPQRRLIALVGMICTLEAAVRLPVEGGRKASFEVDK